MILSVARASVIVDVDVERNCSAAQVASFEADLEASGEIAEPLPASSSARRG